MKTVNDEFSPDKITFYSTGDSVRAVTKDTLNFSDMSVNCYIKK